MTPFRYRIFRSLMPLGITFKAKHLGAAASETYLLREAEEVLGYKCWNECENIDNLSTEYWSLKEHLTNREKLVAELENAEKNVEQFQLARQGNIEQANQLGGTLRETKVELMRKAEILTKKRDEIISEAKQVRRLYEGQQTKLKVSRNAGEAEDSPVVVDTLANIEKYLAIFEQLKTDRQSIADEIASVDDHISGVKRDLEAETGELTIEASELSAQVGALNRTSTDLRAKIGQIDKQKNHLYMKVGNFLSKHQKDNPKCRLATSAHPALARKIVALRNSITLNNRLSEIIEGPRG